MLLFISHRSNKRHHRFFNETYLFITIFTTSVRYGSPEGPLTIFDFLSFVFLIFRSTNFGFCFYFFFFCFMLFYFLVFVLPILVFVFNFSICFILFNFLLFNFQFFLKPILVFVFNFLVFFLFFSFSFCFVLLVVH